MIVSTPLPANVVAVIYHCHVCGSKHTYGRDYFTEVGVPAACTTCETPLIQDDRIPRLETDTPDQLSMKRDDLFRKRGLAVPVREKPKTAEDMKRHRIKELEDQIKMLKGEMPDVPRVRLGP